MRASNLIAIAARLPFFLLLVCVCARKSKVGGQAIIEGVMMRSKQKISWAVRKPNGETVVERFPFISLAKRHKFLTIPVVRGSISLYESLKVGYKALARSAQIAGDELAATSDSQKRSDAPAYVLSFSIALVVCVGVFMYIPMLASQHFFKNSVFAFNGFAGTLRIVLFLLYLLVIGCWKDIRRVFEYHGAEHKAIFAFEDGKELTVETMRGYSTLHPRCGTSFLLLVAIVCIFLFTIIDSLVTMLAGPYPNVPSRLLVHVMLIPIVAGCSYEVLRISDRFQHAWPVRFFILPGLWLQKITTREPNDEQLKIASAALKASL